MERTPREIWAKRVERWQSSELTLDLLAKKAQDQDSTVRHLTPRRIVALGILLLALSGVGFAVVEAMRPPDPIVNPAMKRIAEKYVRGEISREEFTRQGQVHAIHVGICGYFLTYRAYPIYRTLALGGVLAGLTLIAAGAIRARQRSVASPPGS